MKFWRQVRRLFVRARINDIEEALWEDGREPLIFGAVSGSIEERIADINEKLDLLAEHTGVVFKATYNRRRSFELIPLEQDERERAREDAYLR